MAELLHLNDLRVHFKTFAGEVQAVRGVTFSVQKGQVVAIVGESGCGKSVTAHTIMKLIPTPPGKIISGSIFFDGEDLAPKTNEEMAKIRGKEIGMIFQDPMTSLNPTLTIGNQLGEVLKVHQGLTGEAVRLRMVELLKMVGINQPERRLKQYPHEFSGGMRQRVLIAMAIACNPKLLIADEPTTALDVTIQAQIMELLKDLQHQLQMSVVLITHDLGVVAGFSERVVVMYAGKVVEEGTTEEVFYNARHPYTWGLIKSVPRLNQDRSEPLAPIPGRPPDLINPPPGCAFWPRCGQAMKICTLHEPPEVVFSDGHRVSCWLEAEEVKKMSVKVAGV
ncbi:ABC transporter ATP-binding protein [Moorella sulfitireducens]|uniref:ABC transporter ATP-binding protein n=1 Tax=Neomoorella sulfitireducens TaxID=2972948 RepID=UPI0021AC3141|nr:ABC transporter ATP-binding protein [Moorella sulfitireducens]